MRFSKKQLTVLLIDNHISEHDVTILALQTSGFKVIFAADGREGFRQCRREKPDVILSAIQLPGLSGPELCRMIRADRYLRSTPFLLVGKKQDGSDAVTKALAARADDYLPAHFDAAYLTAKLDWLISKKRSDEYLRSHYLTMSAKRHRITSVVKETSVLIRDLDLELKTAGPDSKQNERFEISIDRRIDLGIGMIGAIADLLKEEANALRTWETTMSVGAPAI